MTDGRISSIALELLWVGIIGYYVLVGIWDEGKHCPSLSMMKHQDPLTSTSDMGTDVKPRMWSDAPLGATPCSKDR